MAEKAKTLAQLAEEYGVHVSTLRNWLKPIKDDVYEGKRKLLLPRQYKKIYEFLGEPDFKI
jgi:transposase-like protein